MGDLTLRQNVLDEQETLFPARPIGRRRQSALQGPHDRRCKWLLPARHMTRQTIFVPASDQKGMDNGTCCSFGRRLGRHDCSL
jgi:hypothetical protein